MTVHVIIIPYTVYKYIHCIITCIIIYRLSVPALMKRICMLELVMGKNT